MSHLDAGQRQALAQLQAVIDGADDDVAISVLESVGWDVERAADLVFNVNTEPRMQPFTIDESELVPRPRYTAVYNLARAVFAFPLHILSNIFRFIFGVLRIPIPQLRFSTLSFYRPLPRRPSHVSRSAPDRWVRELEEETGAVSIGTARADASASTTATDSAGPSTLTTRPRAYDDSTKILPDFTLGSYDDALRICQRDARIGCIVLVSEEHDDVADFKRSTLTDPEFVKLLHKNNVVVWGGDVRDREAWTASEKLQATTYPFVAFLALQPRRSPASASSTRSSSSTPAPTLTVLSRHQGTSTAGGPTSAHALTAHMTTQLLPRVTPFLQRIHLTQRERERDRRIREEQDAAFRETARRDRERIEGKIEEERRERERLRLEKEEEGRRREREEERRRERERRMAWRRWGRRVQTQWKEPQSGMRVAVRLPSGGRVIRIFEGEQTLTALYAFVDAQLVPQALDLQEDPVTSPEGDAWNAVDLEKVFEGQIAKAEGPKEWWGFQLASAYPRKEIPWQRDVRLAEVEPLRGGGQVVVEMVGNGREGNGRPSATDNDDGYDTEESEEE